MLSAILTFGVQHALPWRIHKYYLIETECSLEILVLAVLLGSVARIWPLVGRSKRIDSLDQPITNRIYFAFSDLGMSELVKVRPENPVEWLASYLVKNDPQKAGAPGPAK